MVRLSASIQWSTRIFFLTKDKFRNGRWSIWGRFTADKRQTLIHSLWSKEKPPKGAIQSRMKWSGWRESNSRPPAPKAGALPLGYTPNADSILSCVGARERPNLQSITENDDSRYFQSRYDQYFRAD